MKTKEARNIPISQIRHSRFNTRKTRNNEDIRVLAERIKRIGFEETRALWVVKSTGDEYEVFAGGTRLEAAKLTNLKIVPVLVHIGYSDEEISRLSDVDNENDEYHRPVLVTDIWSEYARLYENEGWKQEKIAEIKGVSQKTVSLRLKLHHLPEKIKGFIHQDLLTETHLVKIVEIYIDVYFSPWLTSGQAMIELAEKAVWDKKKNGEKSVRALEADVALWKVWINYADNVYNSLEEILTVYDFTKNPPELCQYKAREEFVQELARGKARSLSAVKEAELTIRRRISDNLEQYRQYLEEKSLQATLEKAKSEKIFALINGIKCGDARKLLADVPNSSVRLLLTDPPYGMNYQSNRRWASKAPEKIIGDKTEEAISLLSDIIQKSISKLTEDAHVLIFCSWRGESKIREILENTGLNVKGSLIWVKEEHSAGDVKGSFAPCHERIVHAVKGNPEVSPRRPDVFRISRTKREIHPMEKPVDLLKQLIESTTMKGDLVLDPFAGSGSTCLAALETNRNFMAFEIDSNYYEKARERLLEVSMERMDTYVSLRSGTA